MKTTLSILVLAGMLAGCGQGVAPSVALPTPSGTPLPSAISTHTAPPTAEPRATSAEPTGLPVLTSSPTITPAAAVAVEWQGLRFSYAPNQYTFTETATTAQLIETPDPCTPDIADCIPLRVDLEVLPYDGPSVWEWAARPEQQRLILASAEWQFDATLGGRPALAWRGDGIFASVITYAVPIGDTVLVVSDLSGGWFAEQARFAPGTAIEAGQLAATQRERALELWDAPTGGARVQERPLLYGGALVTVLALTPQAVQVRTSEGVTGWLHAGAAEALTLEAAPSVAASFVGEYVRATIVHANSIPLRAAPRSDAEAVGAPLAPGQALVVTGLRGDWLAVRVIDDGRQGWARWHYDGAMYIAVAEV